MSVDHGVTVAIIGETGIGWFDVAKAGLLEVNGIIWTAGTQEIYRGHVATVTQDCPLFARTVKENLCYGAKTITTGTFSTELISESAMREAMSLACLDNWIESLPDGLDTVLTDGDRQVSGGQK
ncbi:hypothetical protein SARC_06192 [Sphaeroforma arctica JP610]|uniref:ABC transporter domain-containing protein n=1 Tax=Sphaeroforma arctica JP610 TaxID=667725 RepID=A0A0L0FZT5_9EUKA|nr:hypothetical protein SARC_06192 [Sphaeroforma arctica JP610]KNC81483.1 hypothetical protein SARC_06192 [Sphaeroforma arctica JP610]|eukprot:XP_014155385.1 hypothetical protein SARC_06192 [Sphaeroforma arctica JP610]